MQLSIKAQAPAFAGQRWDFEDVLDSADLTKFCGMKFDSTSTAFMLRELTQIKQKSYDIKYPGFVATEILPVDGEIDPGAESFVWRQYDKEGTAKVIDSYAEDWPMVDVFGQEFQSRCVSFGASYQYSFQDVRAAAFAGRPLETMKAQMARRAMLQAMESVAFFGLRAAPGQTLGQGTFALPSTLSTTDYTVPFGLTNFPNILNAYATGGTGTGQTSTNWTLSSTAVTSILSDINLLQGTVFTTSKGVHKPNTLLLGTNTYKSLITTARSPTFTYDTILQYIMAQSPWLKNVYYCPMLDTAGLKQDNSTAGERVMVMERSEENGQLVMPVMFETLPPQLIGGVMKFPVHMRTAGVSIRYPKAFCYLDGAAG